MDYVLFGMGYGASLMLLGWAFRTFGPQLKYSRPPQHEDPEFLVERRLWLRFVQGLGGVIAIAGTTMVLMTFLVVLINPNDETGATISMAIWGFILAVVLVWCGLYLLRFGLTGIWSRERGYGFRDRKKMPSARRSTTPVFASQDAALTSDEMLITIDDHSGPAEEAVLADAEATGTIADATDTADESLFESPESESFRPESTQNPDSLEPVYDFGDGTDTTVPKDGGGRAEALRRLRQRQARASQSTPS